MVLAFGFRAQDYIDSGKVKADDLKQVKDWLRDEHLPSDVDEMVAVFLRACGGDVELAKRYAKVHYGARKACPEIFSQRDVDRDDVKYEWNVMDLSIMSQRTDEGYAVLLYRFSDPVASHWHMDVAKKLVLMAIDSVLYEEPVPGFVVLVDLKNMGLLHMTRIQISLLRKIFKFVSEGLLHHLKAVHMINGGWVFDHLFKLLKTITKPEVLKLFQIHAGNYNMEEFQRNAISKKCMPADYGGDDNSVKELKHVLWKKIESLQEFYKQEEIARS